MKKLGRPSLGVGLSLGAMLGLVSCSDQTDRVETEAQYALSAFNGLSSINGLSAMNGLTAMNGLSSFNGLSALNGLSSFNGLSSLNGLMTNADGRHTVAYIAKCALAAGDSLTKQDQFGNSYGFPGSLGMAPQWKNGACDQTCQELVSACLMAHVNSYGVGYPLWLVSTASSVGWGLPPSNYKREGTFFGNIIMTGNINRNAVTAPIGYYCEGPGISGGGASMVAGRLGTANAQSAAPFYDAYLGSTCDASAKCIAHKPDGVNVDGHTSCTDNAGNRFTNTVTTWRDPNVAPQFDSSYVYSIRTNTGSAGLAMTVNNGSYANGTKLIQWRFAPTNKFRIVDSGAGNGTFKVSPWENLGMCLDNPGGSTANGTKVRLWSCTSNNPWQQWAITVDKSTGAAYLKNMGSGKCLDSSGSVASGTVPQIWDCLSGHVNQKWRMTVGYWNPGVDGSTAFINDHAHDAYVLLAANGEGNMALDTNAQYWNGGQVSLKSGIDTNKDTKFYIVPGSTAGTWRIKPQWNQSLCLDNPGGQTADGTEIQLWGCNNSDYQNWIVSNRPNGGVEIKNKFSNKCLFNNGAEAGVPNKPMAITWCNGYDFSQIWLLATN